MQSFPPRAGLVKEITTLRARVAELELTVSQRRGPREALRLREARLVEAQRIARLGNWEWDVVHDEVYWSDEMYRIFGVTPEEFTATHDGFLDRVHADDRDAIQSQMDATFRRNAPYAIDFRVVRPDGSVRILRGEGWLERDTGGEPIRLIGTCQDVTERKREEAERQQLLDQVRRARRLEGLAALAEGLANDFKNLLMAIGGQVELAKDVLDSQAAAQDHLTEIQNTVARAAALTNRLVVCSGSGQLRSESIDLNDVIKSCTDDIDRSTSLRTSIRYDLSDDVPPVRGDVEQVRQLLSALVENASQALNSEYGEVIVVTGAMYVDNTHLARAYLAEDMPEGTYAYLRISDTGVGMDHVALEQIFDPFYSTMGSGRGLGLTWVAGVVRSHGGAILVDSEVGRGSMFTVLLPVVSEPDVSQSISSHAPFRWDGTGAILVVDDDGAVRSVIKLLAERRGFRVLLACDGREGLEVVERYRSEIRAVLLDLSMPRMNGEEMYDEMLRLYPEIPVVMMTGTSDCAVMERLRQEKAIRVLQKPFRGAALFEQLRAVLRGEDSPERVVSTL